jgi:nicotinamide mononucleotide transporter
MKRLELFAGAALGLGLTFGSWRGWLPYGLTETLGFVTGAACVYLVVRQNVWNFPLGIANNIFFLVLFTRSRLYGDAGLQIVYVALGIQGWLNWLYGGRNRTALQVSRAGGRTLGVLAVLTLAGTLGLMLVLRAVGGAAPALDAFTTVLSLVAQYMLNRKLIESWYAWITADVIYVYLYVSRGLDLTAALYLVFLCLCVAGLVSWRRALAGTGGATGEAQHDDGDGARVETTARAATSVAGGREAR